MIKIHELDKFTRAYIEAALWSSTDNSDGSGGEPLDKNYNIYDIADETLAVMAADCAAFQNENASDLSFNSLDQGGHDFWLTRNRHGCGFWETPDWPEDIGNRLTDASHKYGEVWLYVGDDGKIYSSQY